jgi:hypothetical protein
MNHIRLYDLFRRELHLSDDKAADFVMAVEDVTGLAIDANKESLATKKDIHCLEKDIHSLEQSMRKEIQKSKEDVYKAIYLSGFIQFIAMLGSILAIIKFMK